MNSKQASRSTFQSSQSTLTNFNQKQIPYQKIQSDRQSNYFQQNEQKKYSRCIPFEIEPFDNPSSNNSPQIFNPEEELKTRCNFNHIMNNLQKLKQAGVLLTRQETDEVDSINGDMIESSSMTSSVFRIEGNQKSIFKKHLNQILSRQVNSSNPQNKNFNQVDEFTQNCCTPLFKIPDFESFTDQSTAKLKESQRATIKTLQTSKNQASIEVQTNFSPQKTISNLLERTSISTAIQTDASPSRKHQTSDNKNANSISESIQTDFFYSGLNKQIGGSNNSKNYNNQIQSETSNSLQQTTLNENKEESKSRKKQDKGNEKNPPDNLITSSSTSLGRETKYINTQTIMRKQKLTQTTPDTNKIQNKEKQYVSSAVQTDLTERQHGKQQPTNRISSQNSDIIRLETQENILVQKKISGKNKQLQLGPKEKISSQEKFNEKSSQKLIKQSSKKHQKKEMLKNTSDGDKKQKKRQKQVQYEKEEKKQFEKHLNLKDFKKQNINTQEKSKTRLNLSRQHSRILSNTIPLRMNQFLDTSLQNLYYQDSSFQNQSQILVTSTSVRSYSANVRVGQIPAFITIRRMNTPVKLMPVLTLSASKFRI